MIAGCFLKCFALVCIGFALVCIVLHGFALVCIGLHWFALVCTGFHWFALVLHWLHWFILFFYDDRVIFNPLLIKHPLKEQFKNQIKKHIYIYIYSMYTLTFIGRCRALWYICPYGGYLSLGALG
jgi:hypothetical protein